MDIDHPTSKLEATAEEDTPTQRDTALEVLRCLNEDWEFLDYSNKRHLVQTAIEVLENE